MSRRLAVSPILAVAASAALLTGCHADPLSVVILNARAPGDKCDFKDPTLYVERGSVDFRPWVGPEGKTFFTNSYFQQFAWENQMQPNPISVNGQVTDPGGGNDFVGDIIVYDYQYSDPSVVLGAETENIRAVISAGGNADDNRMLADLIEPKAAAAVEPTLTRAGKTLLVTFQMFGKTAGGTSKNTNKVSFPVILYRSDTTVAACALGEKLFTTSCGVPGRDADVQCIAAQ